MMVLHINNVNRRFLQLVILTLFSMGALGEEITEIIIQNPIFLHIFGIQQEVSDDILLEIGTVLNIYAKQKLNRQYEGYVYHANAVLFDVERGASLVNGISLILRGVIRFDSPPPPAPHANSVLLGAMTEYDSLRQSLLDANISGFYPQTITAGIYNPAQPSYSPTGSPSTTPTQIPTASPSLQPSFTPTYSPSLQPSFTPTYSPTSLPSYTPTDTPTSLPSNTPTDVPTSQPSYAPIANPSSKPTNKPSHKPTTNPSHKPTAKPSIIPTTRPSDTPTTIPSLQPSPHPSSHPTKSPYPTYSPTFTSMPTISHLPSSFPTLRPSNHPSDQPSVYSSNNPSDRPSQSPTIYTHSLPTARVIVFNDQSPTALWATVIVASFACTTLLIATLYYRRRQRRNTTRGVPCTSKPNGGNVCRNISIHRRLDDDGEDFGDDGGSELTIPSPILSPLSDCGKQTLATSSDTDIESGQGSGSQDFHLTMSSPTDSGHDGFHGGVEDGMSREKDVFSPGCCAMLACNNVSCDPVEVARAESEGPPPFIGGAGDYGRKDGNGEMGVPWQDSDLSTKIGSELMPLSGVIPIAGSPTKSCGREASPITTVSPTRVSKEEFEMSWDADLPYHWDPTTIGRADRRRATNNHVGGGGDKNVVNRRGLERDGSFPKLSTGRATNNASSRKSYAGSKSSAPKIRHESPANTSHGLQSQDSSLYHTVDENRSRDTLDLDTLDWSNKGSEHYGTSNDGTSVSGSTTDGEGLAAVQGRDNVAWEQYTTMEKRRKAEMGHDPDISADFFTPLSSPDVMEGGEGSGVVNYSPARSRNSRNSSGYTSVSTNEGSSNTSSSKQLIHDLVWLEKKIADVRARVDLLDEDESSSSSSTGTPKRSASPTSISRSFGGSPMAGNIVCRDCTAPPGKLQIVIHSTKDGPTIHDVRPGSSLEGQLFSGDLLVAVDDIDTRTFTAEEVMDVMVARSARQRKLTVLHFEEP